MIKSNTLAYFYVPQLSVFLLLFLLIATNPASAAATQEQSNLNCRLMFSQKPPIDIKMGFEYNSQKEKLEIKAVTSKFNLIENSINKLANLLVGKILRKHELSKVTRQFMEDQSELSYFRKLARAFGFQIELTSLSQDEIAKKIPKAGPLIVVANHPRNGTDGIAIAAALAELRPDIKIYMTRLLEPFPEMHKHAFFLDTRDPKKHPDALTYNLDQKQSLRTHLDSGGSVIIFPSGDNSLKKNLSDPYPMDPEWKMMVASLINKKPEIKLLPIFVDGSSSDHYQIIKRIRPQFIADFFVPMFHMREIAHNIDSTFRLVLGTAYTGTELLELFKGKQNQLMEYLRAETHLLRGRLEKIPFKTTHFDPLIEPIPKEVLLQEYSKMTLLSSQNKINVYMAQGKDVPQLVNELGRLREKVFRTVQEGTGKGQDNDIYDNYYHHIVAVDAETGSVLGAYRLGLIDRVINSLGTKGLYNTTLFSFDQLLKKEFFNAIELGRSIVDPEAGPKYKRALDAIWKGIASFLQKNPNYTHLIGPVSLSNAYSNVSKQLIVRYFMRNHLSEYFNQVHPVNGFDLNTPLNKEVNTVLDSVSDIKHLHQLTRDIDGSGLPPLFMSYAKLGAKYLAFNNDPLFNSLDGMIVVDVHAAPRDELLKYFETESALEKYLKGNSP